MQFTKKDTALVKGVAILMMLFHHCFESSWRYDGYEINFFPLTESQTVIIASFFKICVALFVFLSGYGITKSLEKTPQDGYARQIGRRTFSLMSGFWFIFVLGIVSAAIIMPSMLEVYSNKHITNSVVLALYDFLGLAELFGTPTLNSTWWYMSLALIIIAVMPLLYKLYKKFGWIALFMVTFFFNGFVKRAFNDEIVNFDMIRWLFTLGLGMVCADRDILAKIKSFRIVGKSRAVDYVVKLVVYTGVLFCCVYSRRFLDWNVSYIRDGFIPLFVVIYCYTILAEIPVVRNILQFLVLYALKDFLIT